MIELQGGIVEGELVSLRQFCEENNVVVHIQDVDDNMNFQSSQINHSLIENTTDNQLNELEVILKEWGLLHLKEKFSGSGYDRVDDLKIISESDLEAMFPTKAEGSQKSRVRAKIVEWRQINGFKTQVELLSGTTESVTSSVRKWLETQTSTPSTSSTSKTQAQSTIAQSNFDLQHFLKTDRGLKILNCYNTSNPSKLGEYERKMLVDSILEYHYTLNLSMVYGDFERISRDIEQTFLGENKDWYYNRIGKGRPTGRLYNKYRNQAPRLNKIGYYGTPKRIKNLSLSETIETSSGSKNSDTHSESYEIDKEWLGCMNTPWSTVEIKFKDTFTGRQRELGKTKYNNSEFYNDWVIYRHQDGYRLIDIEFEMLFPGKQHCLTKKWEEFELKILPILKTKIKDKFILDGLVALSDHVDSKNITILKALHYVLKPTYRTTRKIDKKVWKVSIQNSIDSFFVNVGPINNLRSVINKKKEFYLQYGMTLQPFMVIQENNQFAVCYDEIFYNFHNILDCLSTAFKIHYAFNLNYAHESCKVWIFLQHYFFGINTSEKVDYDVSALITELTK